MASFLDKVKATQNKGEEVKKDNPLLNKKEGTKKPTEEKKINPLLAALNKKKDKEENDKKKEEAKKNVFDKPKEKVAEKEVKATEEKPKEEVKEEPKKEVEKKEETKKAEVIEEKKEEPKKEEPKKEDNKKAEPKKEEKAKEATDEEKKTKKKEKSKKKETTIDDVSDDGETIKDFNEAVRAIKSNFNDPAWEEYVEEIKDSLSKITIEADMTSTQLKSVMADLTKLRDKVWLQYLEYKTEFEILAGDKPEGKIERIKKTSFTSKDKNDFDRKKAGILACMNYETEQDGKVVKINLFEVCDEYRKRFNFLSEVMKQISFKADALIKMSTGIKLQNSINN